MKIDYIAELKEEMEDQPEEMRKLANEVLDDPRFIIWPASIDKHHSNKGGLARHTWEVYSLAVSASLTTNTMDKMDLIVLYYACLYHDVGKFHDYELINKEKPYIYVWQKSKHNRLIHHINRSAIMWSHDASKYPELYFKYHDKVLHCILSHHGRREWGSPVAPFTAEAWALHLADTMSARLNDCDKIDMLDVDRDKI